MTEDNHDRNDESNRTSIWSVRTEDRFQFSVIFFTLFLIGLCLAACYEIWIEDTDSLLGIIFALVRDVGMVGLASVVLTFARFEGGDIVGVAQDIWKKKEFERGVAEGRRLERESQLRRTSKDTSGTKEDREGNQQQR